LFFLGVRIAVESNFKHNFLHDVDAVAADEKGGRQHGGEEHDDDDVNIAAIAIITAALNATINR
jgi:hypothetical protein